MMCLKKCCEGEIIIRSMVSYGFPDYIRVNVGLPEENKRFVEALKEIL